MKITQLIELAENETDLIKQISGQEITSVKTEVELPPEFAELAKLALQAWPLLKAAFESLEVKAPKQWVNGVDVTPRNRAEAKEAKEAAEAAAENKAAPTPEPEEFLGVDEHGWCIHRSA